MDCKFSYIQFRCLISAASSCAKLAIFTGCAMRVPVGGSRPRGGRVIRYVELFGILLPSLDKRDEFSVITSSQGY